MRSCLNFSLRIADESETHPFQVHKHNCTHTHTCTKQLSKRNFNFVGSGAYADSDVGAAAATGDGDIMMRFLPSYLAIELLRNGATPQQAAQKAIDRIRHHHPKFFGGIIVMNKNGGYAAACNGMAEFPYSVGRKNAPITVERVKCDH